MKLGTVGHLRAEPTDSIVPNGNAMIRHALEKTQLAAGPRVTTAFVNLMSRRHCRLSLL